MRRICGSHLSSLWRRGRRPWCLSCTDWPPWAERQRRTTHAAACLSCTHCTRGHSEIQWAFVKHKYLWQTYINILLLPCDKHKLRSVFCFWLTIASSSVCVLRPTCSFRLIYLAVFILIDLQIARNKHLGRLQYENLQHTNWQEHWDNVIEHKY